MKIAILGTRGIPNYYGGFEQFAEYFAMYLRQNDYQVYVYCSSNHPFKEPNYRGIELIHCLDPEKSVGTVGQFIYDLNCILDARKRNFDVILQLGYTSSSIWHKLLPKKATIITNMDGLEWKRSKYNALVQRFLKVAEKWAVKSSHYLISDSLGIQDYLKNRYNVNSKYIAYGAEPFTNPNSKILVQYNLIPQSYNMLIARMEPENNIETILDGVVLSGSDLPFLVIGKHDTNKFGRYLKNKYKGINTIYFMGGIYDIDILNNLRHYSNLYFHGHSVGGTNPSLLEAMASGSLIVAHDNEFNRAIINSNGYFFKTAEEVSKHINTLQKQKYLNLVHNCTDLIKNTYSWQNINKEYADYINECYKENNQLS